MDTTTLQREREREREREMDRQIDRQRERENGIWKTKNGKEIGEVKLRGHNRKTGYQSKIAGIC